MADGRVGEVEVNADVGDLGEIDGVDGPGAGEDGMAGKGVFPGVAGQAGGGAAQIDRVGVAAAPEEQVGIAGAPHGIVAGDHRVA